MFDLWLMTCTYIIYLNQKQFKTMISQSLIKYKPIIQLFNVMLYFCIYLF
jgi:hypothetical protein